MTPIFCCGFECGNLGTGSGVGEHWVLPGGGLDAVITTTNPITGVRSLRSNVSSGNGKYATTPVFSANAIWVIRVNMRFDSLPTNDAELVFVAGFGSDAPGLAFRQSESKIYCYNYNAGGSAWGATGVSVTTGVVYCIDCEVNIGANPWTIDGKVNGTSLAQLTRAIASNTATKVWVGSWNSAATFSADIYFDDVIISNTAADYPMGNGYVNHFVPTSDGSHNVAGANDFERGTTGTDIVNATTDSYLLVDDVPMDDTTPDTDDSIGCIAPPNSTDYTENKFGPAPGVSTPTTAPRAVEAIAAHHQAGTGTGVSQISLYDPGVAGSAGIVYVNGAGATSTRYGRLHCAKRLDSVSSWTAAALLDLRVRFGYSSDANPDQFFDCAMIEAEFAPLTSIKTLQGVTYDSSNVKTVQGLAIASVKTIQGTA